jgi:hypothetical protein
MWLLRLPSCMAAAATAVCAMRTDMSSVCETTLQRGAGVSSVRATTLQHDLPLLDDVEID